VVRIKKAECIPDHQLKTKSTGTVTEVRHRLETLFPNSTARLWTAMEELEQTVTFARALGVRRQILIRPTMTKNVHVGLRESRWEGPTANHANSWQLFRGGVLFECIRPTKRKDVILAGGRYDCLLAHFTPPKDKQKREKTYGVGMSIAVE
jgi:translation initiation factor 2-alpha kinase 4